MGDAFKDFRVMVETADGTFYPLKPEDFRLVSHCPDTLSLDECVKRYNARMVREGIREHAWLELRTAPSRKP